MEVRVNKIVGRVTLTEGLYDSLKGRHTVKVLVKSHSETTFPLVFYEWYYCLYNFVRAINLTVETWSNIYTQLFLGFLPTVSFYGLYNFVRSVECLGQVISGQFFLGLISLVSTTSLHGQWRSLPSVYELLEVISRSYSEIFPLLDFSTSGVLQYLPIENIHPQLRLELDLIE